MDAEDRNPSPATGVKLGVGFGVAVISRNGATSAELIPSIGTDDIWPSTKHAVYFGKKDQWDLLIKKTTPKPKKNHRQALIWRQPQGTFLLELMNWTLRIFPPWGKLQNMLVVL